MHRFVIAGILVLSLIGFGLTKISTKNNNTETKSGVKKNAFSNVITQQENDAFAKNQNAEPKPTTTPLPRKATPVTPTPTVQPTTNESPSLPEDQPHGYKAAPLPCLHIYRCWLR